MNHRGNTLGPSVAGLSLAQKVHQDMSWALSSPPLMSPEHFPLLLERLDHDALSLPSLEQLAAAPELQVLPTRIGIYFELLFLLWLQRHPHLDTVAHNVPVNDGGQTLGEFDFLVRDQRSGQVFHWEVAIKFFMAHGQSPRHDQWLGPNPEDRLDIKLGKLTGRQTELSRTAAGQRVLESLGIEEVTPGVIFRGRFYNHWSCEEDLWPSGCHAEHLRGRWIYRRQLARLQEYSKNWVLLDRMDWVGGDLEMAASSGPPGDAVELLSHWPARRPVQLALLQRVGQRWREQQRVFVLPDYWPGLSDEVS